jgi:hypothetical protein
MMQGAHTSAAAPLPLEEIAAIFRAAMADGRWADTSLGGHVAAYLDALEYADAAVNTLLAYEQVLARFAVEHADLFSRRPRAAAGWGSGAGLPRPPLARLVSSHEGPAAGDSALPPHLAGR